MTTFHSIFAERLETYVKLRRSLGLKFERQTSALIAFDRHLVARDYEGPLSQELALDFATSKRDGSQRYGASRYQIVRHFSDYLAIFVPSTPQLDPTALSWPAPQPVAHVLSEEDLVVLLDAARNISLRHPTRGITLHAMVGLAASTGLRVGEVVRLDNADVDLDGRGVLVLVIRRTKFGKDRLVPVHASTRDVLRNYAAVRDATFSKRDPPAFFINQRGRRFSEHTLSAAFTELTRRTGLRGDNRKGPTFHSLRHTFAVRRLVEWYRAGRDVQAMLPGLATYMGHVHYSHTAYYLTATAELLVHALSRQDHVRAEGR